MNAELTATTQTNMSPESNLVVDPILSMHGNIQDNLPAGIRSPQQTVGSEAMSGQERLPPHN